MGLLIIYHEVLVTVTVLDGNPSATMVFLRVIADPMCLVATALDLESSSIGYRVPDNATKLSRL